MQRRTLTMLTAVLCAVSSQTRAQGTPAATPPSAEHRTITPSEVKWTEPPPSLPKGSSVAVLYGDPSKPGLFIMRAKVPANYKVMPHWHPTDENITVLSGSVAVGMGDKLDPKAKGVPAGSFISLPAKMHHFFIAKKESVFEVSAMGPFQLIYINPEDDPSKSAKK